MIEYQISASNVKKNILIIRIPLVLLLLCFGYFTLLLHPDKTPVLYIYGAVLVGSFLPFIFVSAKKCGTVKFQNMIFLMDLGLMLVGLYIFNYFDTNLLIAIFLTIFISALSQSVGRSIVVAILVSGLYFYLSYSKSSNINYLDSPFFYSCALLLVVSIHSGYLAFRTVQEEKEILELARNAKLLVQRVREGDQLALREKERITDILGKYISPEVAKKVLAANDGISFKGERRECVIMFTDIRGFTSMSENASPEKVISYLNEYFTLMVDVVFKYEGTLDKFIGDAIMAVWGAPIQFEDKELRGVKAALEMQSVLVQFNQARVGQNLEPLAIGIGLNSGMVVSGNLGSARRTDYTVIGDEVNLASRLCSKATPGQVLISEGMYRKLKGLVEVRVLESIVLKGFTDPVRVYEVVGLTNA